MKKKTIILTILSIITLALTSCGDASFGDTVMAFLGFDTHDYLSEAATAHHEPDSEIALELVEMTKMLSISSPEIAPFSGAKEASSVARDAILNYMLNSNYGKYTGNPEILAKAEEKYPQYHITTIIPAKDFENMVYKSFGGNEKIAHKDGEIFKYLDKISAYTSISQPFANDIEVTVTECVETEKTYRLTFKNQYGDKESREYFALIIKREDGTAFIKTLSEKK
jgi:hypothetical protein